MRGTTRLDDQLEYKREQLTGEHGRLPQEHMHIRDIVRDISLKQENEQEIQKKTRDIVPDAGILRDGIDRICIENAELKSEVIELRSEME